MTNQQPDWRSTPPGTRLPRDGGRFGENSPLAWTAALAITAGSIIALVGLVAAINSAASGWAMMILGALIAGVGAVLHVLRDIGAASERRD